MVKKTITCILLIFLFALKSQAQSEAIADQFATSEVVVVSKNRQIEITIKNESESLLQFTLIDALGRRIAHRKATNSGGQMRIQPFETSTIAQGIYLVKISIGDKSLVRKIQL